MRVRMFSELLLDSSGKSALDESRFWGLVLRDLGFVFFYD